MDAELGSAGPLLAIAAMALATYLCRVSGVVLMSRVRLTPAVERALRALPGSIVAATVVPLGLGAGPAAIAGIAAGILVMAWRRNDLLSLLTGLACAAGARLLGF